MAYEPKEWKCGEKITADALNHIEDGIADASSGDAPFVVTFSQPQIGGVATADKTYAEINEAIQQGKAVIGILKRMDGVLVYQLQMTEEAGAIQGFYVKPSIENGAVSKFEIKAVGVMSNDSVTVSDYVKQ